ncbi:M24 family metallopeptidase [Lignipirellula cremea]|uniref:Putative peptidase n=1 Tax=Lignipirellula cremea TaxID=2528010 RepID=A0A518DY60_9BACT|nr:Xaa-Pro peptidase family protein [Lignipirellula cremea]QDU96780.1 putative peptidase [Lignipirellula cremea]
MDFALRRDKLRKLLAKQGAAAMLVTAVKNVTYLTGFTGDSSWLLLTDKHEVMLSDSRYTIQLAEECPGLETEIRTSAKKITNCTAMLVNKLKPGSIAIEADSLSVETWQTLKEYMPTVQFMPTSGLVGSLREIKDSYELAEIRQSIQLAERAFEVIKARLTPDQTEKQIAADLEYQIRLFGGRGMAFAPIVGVGDRAALPHGTPSEKRIGEAPFVLIDWGARANLYMSDLTRVLATGRISPKLERIYGVVLKAQQQAIDAIRPGALMNEIDAAARSVITEARHGKHFGHGLGHGFGLEIHESPNLSPTQERPLEAGMVITVEPGIYLPDWGGVRIEDDILVTKDGHEVLTHSPRQLEDCVVDTLL